MSVYRACWSVGSSEFRAIQAAARDSNSPTLRAQARRARRRADRAALNAASAVERADHVAKRERRKAYRDVRRLEKEQRKLDRMATRSERRAAKLERRAQQSGDPSLLIQAQQQRQRAKAYKKTAVHGQRKAERLREQIAVRIEGQPPASSTQGQGKRRHQQQAQAQAPTAPAAAPAPAPAPAVRSFLELDSAAELAATHPGMIYRVQ